MVTTFSHKSINKTSTEEFEEGVDLQADSCRAVLTD